MRALDLTGQRFGRLVAVCYAGHRGKRRLWQCHCDCGATTAALAELLRGGYTKSCGCLQREARGASSRTHGRTKSKEYGIWTAMIRRCANPNVKRYGDYGGRGIKVCHRWRESFVAFAAYMGPRPEGATLERINNDGHYEPSNVVWATRREQANNTRRNRLITCGRTTRTLATWSRLTGIRSDTIKERLNRGWTPEEALTRPLVPGRWAERERPIGGGVVAAV